MATPIDIKRVILDFARKIAGTGIEQEHANGRRWSKTRSRWALRGRGITTAIRPKAQRVARRKAARASRQKNRRIAA